MALKKRAVVVGLGSIGRRHARLLHGRGDVEVTFCEPNDEMLALALREVGGLPAHRSYEEALDAKPDFVVIATPHQLHCEQTVKALARGIHVLCEKPMSDRLDSARTMLEAAGRSSAVLSIGFMLRFNPGIRRIKQLIDDGTIGTPMAVQYKIGSYVTLVNSRSRYQASTEGSLLMDYAHQPDIVTWLLGKKPRGVCCTAIRGGDMELSSNPNLLTLVCDYREPLVVTIMLNYVQMPERQECEVIGDRGWILFDAKRNEIRIGRRQGEDVAVEAVPGVRDEMYQAEHQAFLDAVDGRARPSSPPEEAIVSMEIIDAAMRSWRSGRRVTL